MRFSGAARLLSLALAGASWAAPARAADLFVPAGARIDQAAFAFAGRVRSDGVMAAKNPFSSDYEDNFILGGGYQQFWFGLGQSFQFGAEAGAAGRFGEHSSAELWGGVVADYEVSLFETVRVSPSFTVGLSATTGVMSGRERQSEIEDRGDSSLLFYLGPELGISLVNHPGTEFFWRLHHRSGAWRTLGDMQGAADAHVLGMRRRF